MDGDNIQHLQPTDFACYHDWVLISFGAIRNRVDAFRFLRASQYGAGDWLRLAHEAVTIDGTAVRHISTCDFAAPVRRPYWMRIVSVAINRDVKAIQFLRPSSFGEDWKAFATWTVELSSEAIKYLWPCDFRPHIWYFICCHAVRKFGRAIQHLEPSALGDKWPDVCRCAVANDATAVRWIPSLSHFDCMTLGRDLPEVIQHMTDATCAAWLAEELAVARRHRYKLCGWLFKWFNASLRQRVRDATRFASCSKQQRHDQFAGVVLNHAFGIPRILQATLWCADARGAA